jgi:urease accessory protein
MKRPSAISCRNGRRGSFTAGIASFLIPTAVAFGHPGHYHPPGEIDEFDSLVAGFQHPFSGLDHMALALAVGWLVVALGGRKALVPAASFLMALVAGALIGRSFQGGAGLEVALACTLLGAGVLMFAGRMVKFHWLALATTLAGAVHGFAHGAEAIPGAAFGIYVAGFFAATAILVGLGAALKRVAAPSPRPFAPRLAGATLMAMGVISLFSLV